jgi:hypothetical protein
VKLAWQAEEDAIPGSGGVGGRARTGACHGDLYGPITMATPSGNTYFLLLVDDQSHFMWISTLVRKDQAAVAIRDY